MLEVTLDGRITGAAIELDYLQVAVADGALCNSLVHSTPSLYIMIHNVQNLELNSRSLKSLSMIHLKFQFVNTQY